MTSLSKMAIALPVIACLSLTSCGPVKIKKVARQLQPGDQIFFDPVVTDEQYIKLTGKPPTSDQKEFFHTCTKVTFGMSEKEIDAVMSGYPSQRFDAKEDGSYVKVYDAKPNANVEYEYHLIVTFDDTHHLVEANVGDLLK